MSVIANRRMKEEYHKRTTLIKYKGFYCFIFSVQSLRLLKYVEMDNGHNGRGIFFVLVATDSSSISES